MDLNDVKKILHHEEYGFLRENENLGDSLMLMCLGGSMAYGTNIDTSDIDIRGVAVNSRKEILLGTDFGQISDNGTDTVIYSFKKIIKLLSKCNPSIIEMLGCRAEHYLHISDMGKQLLENRGLFLSKKAILSFGGMAGNQLYRLTQKSAHSMKQSQLEEHIHKTLNSMMLGFHEKYAHYEDDSLRLYIDKSEREDMDTEIFMDIRHTHYPLRDYCSMWSELQSTAKSYAKVGRRNSRALEHGKIAKHMMHLVRLYYMCFDILENHEIVTYREKEHGMLMEIRAGKYITGDNQVMPEFFELVDGLEKRLAYDKDNTTLPDVPDYDRINEFVMDINEQQLRKA